MSKTTHTELANLIHAHAARLANIPAGFLVSDNATLHALRSAAVALVAQDFRIGQMTIALRACRDALPEHERAMVNECLSLGAKRYD
jgi:hypothetical protein